jgi:organic radical activating enzyme
MVHTIIQALPHEKREVVYDGSSVLHIAEMFSDTIQGEGPYIGHPATFLRLQGCTLNCCWCDTNEVWRCGNPYSVNDLISLCKSENLFEKLKTQHLVITGGSPLKQQNAVLEFLMKFEVEFGYKPFVEVENECVIKPTFALACCVDAWNNSPKLSNCGCPKKSYYKPEVIKATKCNSAWWKFVVQKEEDIKEIIDEYVNPFNLPHHRIFLMPEGSIRSELQNIR